MFPEPEDVAQVGQAGRAQPGTWSVTLDTSLGLWDPELPRPCCLCPWESRQMLACVGAQSAFDPRGGAAVTPSPPAGARPSGSLSSPLPSGLWAQRPVPALPLPTARPSPGQC